MALPRAEVFHNGKDLLKLKIHRKFHFITVFLLVFLLSFETAFAAESTDTELPPEEASTSFVIEEIMPLESGIAHQSIIVRSGKKPSLPAKLSVRLAGQTDYTNLDVSWSPSADSIGSKVGTFTCIARIPSAYTLKEGLSVPSIRVEVKKEETTVSGIPGQLKKKARSSFSHKITVSPAYGRTVQLQMKKNGKWITKKTYKTSDRESASLTVAYPNDWWKVTNSSWRILAPESPEGTGFSSSSITIKTKRYYQNPAKYVQIKDKIVLKHSGTYKLRPGYMGLKVRKVNNFFHIGSKYWPRYTSLTRQKVKAFQRRKHLKATGVVNLKTWTKMGFSKKSWKTLGAYVSPIKVNPSSTKKQHINAMIRTAKKYLGSDYVVGASGKPSQGADCSGLIMQALYAAGVDPYPVSCVRHSKAGYEYESRNLWTSKKFKAVPYSKKKRGDLIFYRGGGGAIIHVAIYLGDGKVIESWPNKVVIWPIKNSHRSRVAGVRRVFN